jgi:23S rRNA-/tRNA-specific pseudouridylate synthase
VTGKVLVLEEGPGFLAVDKPPGTLVIPGRAPTETPSLKEQLEQELGRPLFTVHRLDKDTSGVLLFATDAATHRTLSMAFEAGEVKKRYLCLVAGVLLEPRLIDIPLTPARRGLMRPARPGEEGKASQTRVTPLESFQNASWVQAEPLTGRTHQIRVHLLTEGFPLLVDPQYRRPSRLTAQELGGEGEEPILTRTPLHCAGLTLPGAMGNRTIEAPLPGDFRRALELLRAPSKKSSGS